MNLWRLGTFGNRWNYVVSEKVPRTPKYYRRIQHTMIYLRSILDTNSLDFNERIPLWQFPIKNYSN